jgi:hypothetical protein
MTDPVRRVEGAEDRPTGGRRWLVWIGGPAFVGVIAGVAAASVPGGRDLLGFAMAVSGLAWVLRVASDWFAERAGPQRGTLLLASVLFGMWLVLALSAPGPLRRMGFGPLRLEPSDQDPYAIPPAGSPTMAERHRSPSILSSP